MRNQVLGNRYRIIERIGEGGMAFVYLALDEKLGRKVAVKVLHEHMESNEEVRRRFQMEAQAISGLDHPNILKIYDFSGNKSSRLWIVTEVIHGKNLAQLLTKFKGGWINPVIATCITREICKALQCAHAQGIVHRDIKPENIMITDTGRVKLMDFGIAKDLGKSHTMTGTFMGSPSYMSPEQIRGRDIDHRSDIYSLCVLFYEIITGRLPYIGQTTHEVVLKIMEGKFTYPRFIVADLPEEIDAIVVKGMAHNYKDRFQRAQGLGQKLDHILASLNLNESHIELERFFKDPQNYMKRLNQKSTIQSHVDHETRLQTQRQERTFQKTKHDQDPSQFKASEQTRTLAASYNTPVTKTAYKQKPIKKAPVQTPAQRKTRGHPSVNQANRAQRVEIVTVAPTEQWLSTVFGVMLVSAILALAILGVFKTVDRISDIEKAPQTKLGKSFEKAVEQSQTFEITQPKQTHPPKRLARKKPDQDANKIGDNIKNDDFRTKKIAKERPPQPKAVPTKTRVATKPVQPKKQPVIPRISQTKDRTTPKASAPSTTDTQKPAVNPNVSQPTETQAGQGSIAISSQPAAEIFLNGERLGTTVDKERFSGWIKVTSGQHFLELRRDGYEPYKQKISVKANQKKRLSHVTLEKNKGLSRHYVLTLRVSQTPAKVSIRNLDENDTQTFTMTNRTHALQLENGRFHVRIEQGDQVRERTIILTANQNKLTFTADFGGQP